MPEVNVKTVKGFQIDGCYAKRGSEFPVEELTARELLRNGLIEDYAQKAAAQPENKKAPEPENKSGPKPNTKKKAD